MSHVITRKSIKHFENLQKRYITQHNGEMCEMVDCALKAMKETSWIPVSERLPEEDGSFLCSFEINDKRWIGIKPYGLTNYQESLQGGITPKYYGVSVRKYFYEPSYNMELENVVAWRPLPEEYKGE